VATKPDFLDWDSIKEAQGFRVGDSVRYRGPHVGIIRNLISTKGRMIARVYWPTIPFESEGYVSPNGSEQFQDLDRLTKHIEPTKNLPMIPRYCDFGRCSNSCWMRCDQWPAMAWRAWKAQNQQPRQKDLFEATSPNSNAVQS
jgi:hypothetical protein